MNRRYKPDPYNGFKDDRERRLALNVRVLSYSVVAIFPMASTHAEPMETLRWLMHLFH